MDAYLFFYLFYNIHNGRFLDRLKYNWLVQKYIYTGGGYYRDGIDNVFKPPSMVEFTINAEYFIDSYGFYKELNLFEPQYFHYHGESLYSQKLDFILMAYAKKTMKEVFTIDHSYETLFANVASEYAEHAKINKISLIEREIRIKETGIKSKSNFGYTNNSLGYFSNAILKRIQDRYNIEPHCFTSHNEIYEYLINQFADNSVICNEFLIAKKIIDGQFITTTNFLEIVKNGFEINFEISSLIKALKKNK